MSDNLAKLGFKGHDGKAKPGNLDENGNLKVKVSDDLAKQSTLSTVLSGLNTMRDEQGRIYGQDGSGNWRPIRINSSGQLELASNVTIDNVTVNVGAEVAVYNRNDEPLKVQQSGTVVEVHTLVNALAITDTNMRTASISNVVPNRNSYARFEIYIRNTLDTEVRIGFGSDHGFLAAIPGKSGSSIPYTPISASSAHAFHVVPPTLGAGSRPLRWYPITNDDVIDKLAYLAYIGVGGGSNLVYKAVNQPTSGSLSIWFVGWKS